LVHRRLFRNTTTDSLTQVNYNLPTSEGRTWNSELLTRRRRPWIGERKNFHRRIYPFNLLRR